MFEYLLVGVLALWLSASLLAQFTTWDQAPKVVTALAEWFRGWDYLSLVPAWNFFAPNPGTTDYHLLYRDKLDSGDLSVWKEIQIDKEPSLLRVVWNPRKRKSKVLADVIGIVNQSLGAARNKAIEKAEKEFAETGSADRVRSTAPGEDEETEEERFEKRARELFQEEIRWLKLSIPYLVILNYLSNIPHPVFSASTQFLFAETRAYDRTKEPQVLYVSEFHNLP